MVMVVMENGGSCTYELPAAVTDRTPTAAIAVYTRFQRSPFLPLRRIKCSLHNGMLVLRGRVPTYYLKQLVQTIGISIEGVEQVVNDLRVDFPENI